MRGGSSPPFPTITDSSRTISPSYNGEGSIVFRPGYLPVFNVKSFQNRFTQQAPLVKIAVLIQKIKLGSQLKGYLKISFDQMLALPDTINRSL